MIRNVKGRAPVAHQKYSGRALVLAAFTTSLLACSSTYAKPVSCAPSGDQWYTGSLISPAGALPKAGMVAAEAYMIGSVPVANFDARGHSTPAPSTQPRSVINADLIAYALTDHLTIKSVPSFMYNFDSNGASNGVRVGDVPVDFLYRFIDPQPEHCIPAVTAILGVTAPVGTYDNLRRIEDASGAGAWALRFGLQSQFALLLPDGRPLRVRLWAQASLPVSEVGVNGASVYGTPEGFTGTALPHISGSTGISFEYGLTRNWVFALDVVRNFAEGAWVRGYTSTGGVLRSSIPTSNSWTIAPAIEYNWSPNYGIIFGVAFTPAGRNTTNAIQPQIAFNMVF